MFGKKDLMAVGVFLDFFQLAVRRVFDLILGGDADVSSTCFHGRLFLGSFVYLIHRHAVRIPGYLYGVILIMQPKCVSWNEPGYFKNKDFIKT